MDDRSGTTESALAPERPVTRYTPPSSATTVVATPPSTEVVWQEPGAAHRTSHTGTPRASAQVRKREAQDALSDALGAVIEALRRKKKERQNDAPVEAPPLFSLAAATLLLVAFDLAFVIFIVDKFFPATLAAALSKAVAAIFGVALVAYTEQLRVSLLRASRRWTFRGFVVAAPLLVIWTVFTPYTLRVRTLGTVVVDGVPGIRERADILRVRVTGMRAHALLVQEDNRPADGSVVDAEEQTIVRNDTLELGPREMFLGAANGMIPGLRWLRGAYVLATPAANDVIVQYGSNDGAISVRGVFPTLHLRKLRRLRVPITRDRGDTVVATFDPLPGMTQVPLRLPSGTYDITVAGSKCIRTARAFEVASRRLNEIKLDQRGCPRSR